jgi:PAS domain S-box-containing protein
VIDHVPRELSAAQRSALAGLARIVVATLLERRQRLALSGELAAAEADYRFIVEHQSELISLASADGTLRYVSPAYAQFFGLQPPAMVGRNLADFVEEADRPAVRAHLRRVCEGGVVAGGVNRMVSASGQERWVAWTNRPVPGGEGRPATIHSVGRDITAQRQAEQALADNEARSRRLYDATPAMLHSVDLQGRLLNVSDHWLAQMGYTREEVIGRASVGFLTPASSQYARDVVLPAFYQSGRCDDVAYQMVRKDGSLIDVLLSAVLERDERGEPLRSLAVVQDVTERKATAAALHETTHTLQLVLDSLPARTSYWDVQRRNRFANKAFQSWFGAEPQAMAGRHARDVLGPAWYARIEHVITSSLEGEPGQIELSSPGPGGALQHTDLRFIPDRREGTVCGLFVFALDVTAHRQAERELADREQRFKLLVDGVRDHAIYMLDPQGRVATWNAGAQRSYRAEQVLGQPFALFFTPEDVALGRPAQALALAARAGRHEAEAWCVRGDGSRFWGSVLLNALQDDAHQLLGYACITHDLTEQKRQQALLLRVVELAPCAMLMADADGGIVMVNAQAEQMFGYGRAELLGRPLTLLVPALPPAGFTAMGAGHASQAMRKSGQAFPIEIGLGRIDSADGPATLAAVFDITQRRAQQAATEQALAEKETLLKEVYHRVKNNLQVVQSLLNLQQRVLPEGAARNAFQDTVLRVRAMALVHEKLYQSGNLAAISLPAYTRDLLGQLAAAHGGAGAVNVSLHCDIAAIETGLDNAVPYGLLLTELVTNCFKHAFPGGRRGTVHVSLVRQPMGGLLTVADDGVGFADAADGRAPLASMGLTLAQSLAQQLGGELHTRSGAGWSAVVSLARL